MRKIAAALILFFLVSSAAADIEARIDTECGEAEPVISISDPDKDYSHPAEPDYYEDNLCVSGISEASIQEQRCSSATGFHLSSKEDNAHFSVFSAYRLNVCTGEMKTRITPELGACNENETALASVSGRDNAHVAGPEVFDHLLCGSYITPSNISLSVEFNLTSSDQVYFDSEEVDGEQRFESTDYPALVSEGDEMVSGIVVSDFREAERRIEGENILKMEKTANSSSFIIPFTEGDLGDIEEREEEIEDREFLNSIRPSFAYLIPEEPMVRAVYDPDIELDSNITYNPGRHSFKIIKIGENQIGIY